MTPDELLFSVMIRAYGKRSPPAWADVSSMLAKMRNSFGIPPHLLTCARAPCSQALQPLVARRVWRPHFPRGAFGPGTTRCWRFAQTTTILTAAAS